MNFKEKLAALKEEFKAKITPESSSDDVTKINELTLKLDELATDYDSLITENAKFKDTIVRMVTTQGSSDVPVDENLDAKPKTMDEIIAAKLNSKGV